MGKIVPIYWYFTNLFASEEVVSQLSRRCFAKPLRRRPILKRCVHPGVRAASLESKTVFRIPFILGSGGWLWRVIILKRCLRDAFFTFTTCFTRSANTVDVKFHPLKLPLVSKLAPYSPIQSLLVIFCGAYFPQDFVLYKKYSL